VPPELPKFDLATSPLFQGLVDGALNQVWEFWGDGEYPDARRLKEEADRRIGEVLATWTDADLEELAAQDSWSRAGLAEVGVEEAPDPLRQRRQRFAMRVVELGLGHAEAELARRALDDPQPADRAYRTVPGLWDALSERDFLLPLTTERVPADPISSDPYLYFGDYAVFPHPYLRPARELFWDLCDLVHNCGLAVQVAIDPFRVLPRSDVPMWLLEDYWYGVKVTRETLDSLEEHHLGRSLHYRNLDTLEGKRNEVFYPLIATEFDWSVRDETIKVLQVEEIRPAPAGGGDEPVLNRYLHSERDTRIRAFSHLDGALKGYPVSTYQPSRKEPLAKRGKATIYRKLFRVDGKIPDDPWGMTVGQFYRRNELIAEHLGELVDERAEAA
jgi:hypothetical protein